MSLSTILSTASSGMTAAQVGLRTVSDNIANVNTPGYVRKVVDQVSLVTLGAGAGVDVTGIRRVVDRYLQGATLSGSAQAGQAGIRSELLDRIQSQFGDPSAPNSFFNRLDDAFTEFAALANDPSSSLQRGEAVSALQIFFDDASRIASSLTSLKDETDSRMLAEVDRANHLLGRIAELNMVIAKARIVGTDSSGSENIQAQLVNELSGLMDVQMQARPNGGVTLRSADGMLLAGDSAATLTYNRSETAAGYLTVAPADGAGQQFEARLSSGSLVGMMEMSNREIPAILSQIAEYVGQAANEINRAHNTFTAVPAPATMVGRNTGLDDDTAVAGFTGQTTIAVLDAAGVIQRRVAIDFDGPGISVDGGPPTAFNDSTFVSVLNTALGPMGSASFANGALTLNATGGRGLAVVDDAADPARKAGQGFSHFFGLNDLVQSGVLAPFNTGLRTGDAHGFTAGQTMTLRLTDASGARLRDVAFTVPAGATMGALISALNAAGTGVSPYGSFALDANGRLSFSSNAAVDATVSVVEDNTQRGAGGPSISTLFGIGPKVRALAAASFSVNPAINYDPSRLALAKVDIAAGVGVPAVSMGDGRGGFALGRAGETSATFAAVGSFPAATMTVSRYGSEFAGLLGRKSSAAETQLASAEAFRDEAENRRTSYEGVNIDEELIRMTTYQQAFNASARLVQASNELYDILMNMI